MVPLGTGLSLVQCAPELSDTLIDTKACHAPSRALVSLALPAASCSPLPHCKGWATGRPCPQKGRARGDSKRAGDTGALPSLQQVALLEEAANDTALEKHPRLLDDVDIYILKCISQCVPPPPPPPLPLPPARPAAKTIRPQFIRLECLRDRTFSRFSRRVAGMATTSSSANSRRSFQTRKT